MISMKPEDMPPVSLDQRAKRWGGRTDTPRLPEIPAFGRTHGYPWLSVAAILAWRWSSL